MQNERKSIPIDIHANNFFLPLRVQLRLNEWKLYIIPIKSKRVDQMSIKYHPETEFIEISMY